MQTLLAPEGLLNKLVLQDMRSIEINCLAINCIEIFLENRENNNGVISQQCKIVIKEMACSLLSSLKNNEHESIHYNKVNKFFFL